MKGMFERMMPPAVTGAEAGQVDVSGAEAGQVDDVTTIYMPPVPAETADIDFSNVVKEDPAECITNPSVPDMTAGQVVKELEQFVSELASLVCLEAFSVPLPVAVKIDGSTTKIAFAQQESGYVLKFGLRSLIAPRSEIASRIIHEFVHMANDIEFVQDTSENGYYHSEVFAKQAENFGLKCKWTKSYGFGNTELSSTMSFPDTFFLPPDTKLKVAKVVKKGTKICPHCGKEI